MPTSRYDPARDIFTSDPIPPPPTPAAAPPEAAHAPPFSTTPYTGQDRSSPPRHQAEPPKSSPPAREGSAPKPTPSASSSRKRKASPSRHNDGQPIPPNQDNSPKIKRRRPASPPPRRARDKERDRGRSSRYRYNSPPPPIVPRGPPKDEDPTPPPSRRSSPPRKRKRPGAASRLSEKEKDIGRQTMQRREEHERARLAEVTAGPEKVEEVVRSHYNDKKELGKEWRQQSKIKGLRSFNNWVKSTLIQKFSPSDDFDPRYPSRDPNDHLVVLDMGCGKGGDLLKWKSAPQEVGFYLGVDSADVSIAHAHDRFDSMIRDQQRSRGGRNGRPVFQAEFHAMDCWNKSLESIPIVQRIGFDAHIGPGNRMSTRFSQGGFDIVTMMFCMHYAFETEQKCRTMLKNVAGALKPGGRFIGTIPSSDIISSRVRGSDSRDKLPENPEHGVQEWGNSIYKVKFAQPPPRSGTFRPPWGWEYNFFLEEAVDAVPEYVVPWEAFRGIAEDYNLELEYKKYFHDVWKEEKDHPELKMLSERMGVRNRNGDFALGDDEWEACGFYLAFAFRKS